LLDVRKQEGVDGEAAAGAVGGAGAAGRELLVGAVVVVQGQADLLEVVLALEPGGGRSDLLDGGEQQRDQARYDRNHRQHLNEGEAGARVGRRRGGPSVQHGSSAPEGSTESGNKFIRCLISY